MTDSTDAPKGERPAFDGKDVTIPMAGATPVPPTPRPADSGTAGSSVDGSWAGDSSANDKSWVAENPAGGGDKSWVDSAPQGDSGPVATAGAESDSIGAEPTRADLGTPNQAGRRLGDFQLEKKIGQGGMGEVYRARQISLDRPVAVKVLTRGLASQPGFVERFQREAKAAANVVHPHIIQIYAYGIDNGTPYFAMEYVEGEDLQQRMRRVKRIPVEEIVDTMIAVASALGAAHEKNMIHRDVKPSNVMIDRQGNVKVMDFGLAKAASADGSLTQSGVIMGTPNYLSPEQGRGDPIDGRADLYSLGVVMYELLAGDLPFRADTPAGLIFKHVYEDPTPLRKRNAEVPPFVEEIVHKLLRKDPADRYQNARELLVDLNEFIDAQDHYMAGGARRPNVSASSRLRGAPRIGSETTMTDQPVLGPEDAPTQRVEKKDLTPAPVTDATNRSQVTIIREKPSLAPLWILIFMAALGGGTFVLYQNGTLAKWGLLQKQLKLQLGVAQLPAGATARLEALDGPTRIDLKADEGYFLDAGKYRITVDRRGYQKVRTELFVQDDGGKAALVMPSGTQFAFKYDPTPEMVDAYTKGRAALERGKTTGDKDAFNEARALLAKVEDPSFAMDGGKPAGALADEAYNAVNDSMRHFNEAQALAQKKSWRKLAEMADGFRNIPEWAALYDQAKKALENETVALGSAEAAQEKADFDGALRHLDVAANENPEDTQTIQTLRQRVVALKEKRVAALDAASTAITPSELDKALELLGGYLLAVKSDPQAAEAARRVQDRIKNDLSAPLVAAIQAHDWSRADTLWNELKRTQPQHERLGQWRTAIDEGKRELDVKGAVEALDAALVQSDVAKAVDRLLDGSSEAVKAEKRSFAEMREANARFVSSAHTIRAMKIEASGSSYVARVDALWKTGVEVGGDRFTVEREHVLELRLVGGAEWKFTSFAASEVKK